MKKKGLFSHRPVTVTIIAVMVLLLLMLITSGTRTVSWVENAVGVVVTPIQTFAQTVSNAIVKGVRELFNTTDADKENAKLKAQVAELEVAVESYEELRQENERLKDLLNYADSMDSGTEYVTATVIANSNSVWFDMFTLNAGKNSNIDPGDPVVTGDGLVGIVTDVGATWCKVRSVIDGDTKVGVIVERTRDNGFVRGTLASGSGDDKLELYFMPSGSDLTPGDKIVTNGLGGDQIPKGIIVGTVSEVMRVSGTGTDETNAVVLPAVDFLHLEDVMVITSPGG
ncbi:MAG: rod shape-determining protein MreC [Clostridia bacterium]|nr:rod shape-determining protein MreC [Clostridia bacterium]